MAKKIAIAVGVVVLLGVVVLGLRLYPWLRGPSTSDATIDARWSEVEKWAEVSLTPADRAKSELEGVGATFKGWAPPATAGVPSVELATLSAARRTALERLENWAKSGAPMPNRSCPGEGASGASALNLFRAGQAAVFTSEGADQLPRVQATLWLAERLRRRGSVLDLAVGAELAVVAAKWSDLRGVPLPKELVAKLRPQASEIRRAFAREAVCMIDRIELEGGAEGLGLAPHGPPFGIVSWEREKRVYKDFHGRLLEEMAAAGDDWREVARRYEAAAGERPNSVLIGVAAIQASVISNVGQKIDEFDALIPRSR